MNNLDNCYGYALIYLVTAFITVPICIEAFGFIAVTIEPCSGYGCMMHSLLSLMFGFLVGGFVIPPLVCFFISERNRNKEKKKRS